VLLLPASMLAGHQGLQFQGVNNVAWTVRAASGALPFLIWMLMLQLLLLPLQWLLKCLLLLLLQHRSHR
jgi:hypothetical protein